MSTHKNTWKARERQIASFFYTKRTPLSGGNSGITRSDSLSDTFFVEAKLREKHATCSLYRDTAKLAKLEGKIPVVALTEKGREGFLIVVDSRHFLKLLCKYLIIRARTRLKPRTK
jgi:hypothetical protein